MSGNPGGNNRASANQRETQLRGRPGRGVSVVRVDSGGGELSQRLAGDSRRTERLIMRDPELGVTIDHYLGSLGIHHYAAGPDVSFASGRATRPCILAAQIQGGPSFSRLNHTSRLLFVKVRKWGIVTERPQQAAFAELLCLITGNKVRAEGG